MSIAAFPQCGEDRPSLEGDELIRVFGAEPPVMADYSAEVVALFPSEASQTDLILDALPKAIARVGLSLSLAGGCSDRAY
jgi:hypothetical protein